MTLRSHPPTGIRIGGRTRRLPLLPALLILSLAVNAWLLIRWQPKPAAEPDPSLTEATVAAAAGEAALPASAAPAVAPTPAPAPAVEPAADGPRRAHVVIEGAVTSGFVDAVGAGDGDRLALTASRLLVWNLSLTKDPRKGDTVDLVYQVNPDDPVDIRIDALRYRSEKFGRDYEAFRFQPEGWAFASWFDAAGLEVPGRLDGGPIAEYEQVTSLLGDGRGHQGMDFKAPVGTPVRAPFAGRVTRTNWNWRFNGNSIEIEKADGTLARLLHLEEVDAGVKPGVKLAAGDPIARSGNTGRSSGPHLHYELSSRSGKVLDPLKLHPISRRSLKGADLVAFQDALVGLQAQLAREPAAPAVEAEAPSDAPADAAPVPDAAG